MKIPEIAELESCISRNGSRLNEFLGMPEGQKFISYCEDISPLLYNYKHDSFFSVTLKTLYVFLMDDKGFGQWHGELSPTPPDSIKSIACNLSYLTYLKKNNQYLNTRNTDIKVK